MTKISLCNNCHCMTKTTYTGYCGKCGADKTLPLTQDWKKELDQLMKGHNDDGSPDYGKQDIKQIVELALSQQKAELKQKVKDQIPLYPHKPNSVFSKGYFSAKDDVLKTLEEI